MGNNIYMTINWYVLQPFLLAPQILPSNLVLELVAKVDMYDVRVTNGKWTILTIPYGCGFFMGLHENNLDPLQGKPLFS